MYDKASVATGENEHEAWKEEVYYTQQGLECQAGP